MANATAITVTDLSRNGWTDRPTADVLDTGTAAVALEAAIADGGRVVLEVTNTAAANLTVAVTAGDNPPAQAAGQGAASKVLAQNAVGLFGPFETMRFGQDSGKLAVTFTPASGTIGASVRCYQLPKA